jgi:hypothetical protein
VKVYIGQTVHSLKPVSRSTIIISSFIIQVSQPWRNSIIVGNCILLNDTDILAKKSRCMVRIIRKTIEIKLYYNNINREDEFSLSWSWKQLIHILKE